MKTNLRLAKIIVVTLASLFLVADAMAVQESTYCLEIAPPGSVSIPDDGTRIVSLTVTEPIIISDVDVYIYIAHRFLYDLSASLIAPDGKEVVLFDRVLVRDPGMLPVPPDPLDPVVRGIGTKNDMCHFDDEATLSISDASPLWEPFVPLMVPLPPTKNFAYIREWLGDWKPVGKLSDFKGKNAQGQWQLKITDNDEALTGELRGFCLRIQGEPLPFVSVRITDGGDDVEEHVASGEMDITSTDLELAYEDAGTPTTDPQVIGLRFVNLAIPKGAIITKAYVEFEVDSVSKAGSANPVNLIIEGDLTAAPFTSAAKDVTSRTSLTTAKANWSIPPWTATNEKFQTSDISSVIQELINQPGWASGNAVALIFSDDKANPSTGLREAESVEGEAGAAPLLYIEYAP